MKVFIYSDIGSDTLASVHNAIEHCPKGEPIDIQISSCGGEAFSGLAVADLLTAYTGQTKCTVWGVVASAASLIALACDEVLMSPNAMLMVHSAYCEDASDEDTEVIRAINEKQCKIIQARCPSFDIKTLEAKDTWLDAEQCVKLGLANGIVSNVSAVASKAYAAKFKMEEPTMEEVKTDELIEQVIEQAAEEQAAETVEEEAPKAEVDMLSLVEALVGRVEALEQALAAMQAPAEPVAEAEQAEDDNEKEKEQARMSALYGRLTRPCASVTAPKAEKKIYKVRKGFESYIND